VKTSLAVPVGLVMLLVGLLWAGQGFGWVHGSPMTGETLWAVVGPIVALVGLLLTVLGFASRKR
jgi:hypothetical protein